MKAAVYSNNGSPEVFSYEEVNDPIPGASEVLIKVEAISIEGGDISNRELRTPPTPKHIVGYAATGKVIQVGADVTKFKEGDPVITFNYAGSHAELRAAPEALTYRLPEGMNPELAVTSFIAVGTAAFALQLAEVREGERILISGATGGVGVALVQLAKLKGANVVATARTEKYVDLLKDFGATDVIVTDKKSIEAQAKDLIPDGVDVFIDTVGMDVLLDGMKAVKNGGKVVLIAGRAGDGNFIDPIDILGRRLSVFGCYLGGVMQEPAIRELIEDNLKLVADGSVKTPVSKVFKLADVVAAHTYAAQGGKVGRVVLVP